MDFQEALSLPPDSIERMHQALPFYREVKQNDHDQYQNLLKHSRIIRAVSEEKIIEQGKIDAWSYFLVNGTLFINLPDAEDKSFQVGRITPGEVFGNLAALLKRPRIANVVVAPSCKEATIFATDFKILGALEDFSELSLNTKLLFYRHSAHNLRWKLELFRSNHPQDVLANQHRTIKLFSGPEGGIEELQFQYKLCSEFTKLMIQWNNSFTNQSSNTGKGLDLGLGI